MAIEPLEDRRLLALAANFLDGQIVGTVESTELGEVSGMVASRQNAGVLWMHNDSGDQPRLFALDTSGAELGVYSLGGAAARDWEDIAIGPGPTPGVDYLYIADTGDNAGVHPGVTIYRVAEPVVSASQSPLSVDLEGVEAIEFVYPDGPRDAETLLIDPWSGDLVIVTKRDENFQRVYSAAFPQTGGTLTFEGEMAWTGAVGGDVSPSGLEILIKNYNDVSFYSRPLGSSIAEVLIGTPAESVPYVVEPKGESITFDPASGGYFTFSEGFDQPLYFYGRDETTPADTVTMLRDGQSPASDYDATRDVSLRQSAPQANFAGEATLVVGDGAVTLLKWDLSTIPLGTQVEEVSLTVHVSDPTSGSFQLFAVARDWTESEASWTRASVDEPWQQGGAAGQSDLDATLLGTLAPDATGSWTVVLDAAGRAVVQSWVNDPSSNRGLLIAAAGDDPLAFDSRESSAVFHRPRLSVQHAPPDANPPSAALILPADNEAADSNPSEGEVLVGLRDRFEIHLSDAALDDASVRSETLSVTRDDASFDGFTFSYDGDANVVALAALGDTFPAGEYRVTLNGGAAKISDMAGNELPTTVFSIVLDAALPTFPVATGDAYQVDEDVTLDVAAASGLLANDFGGNDVHLVVLIDGPSHGDLALDADGSFVYTPAENYNGPDRFSYVVRTPLFESPPALVDLTVRSINDVPRASDDEYNIVEDAQLSVDAAAGVLANDVDAEGTTLTALLAEPPTDGDLALRPDGSFIYGAYA